MQVNEVKAVMAKYFVEHLGIDADVASDGSILVEDLAIGSMAIVEMFAQLEDAFGVFIEDFTVLKGKSIDEIAHFVCELKNVGAAA